jgi:hypothetical protein
MIRRPPILSLTFLIIAAAALQADAAIMDSINADKVPVDSPWGDIAEVGWLYTPQESYYLTGVNSKFGPSSTSVQPPFQGTSVTVEVYDELPGSGGTLLCSASFGLFQWGVFVGGTFDSYELTAGEDYFIGFVFTGSLILKNTTTDAGAVSLTCYGDDDADGTYSDLLENPTEVRPILQFEGEPIPEPATILLVAFGGSILLRRKR